MEQTIAFSTMNHSIECAAYKVFGKNPPIPLPIIYAATECQKDQLGAIVMEDFGHKAAIIGDPTCTLSLEQLYAAADAVADWHAWCYTTDVDWQSHFEAADSERRKQTFAGWFDMMKNCFEVSVLRKAEIDHASTNQVSKSDYDCCSHPTAYQNSNAIALVPVSIFREPMPNIQTSSTKSTKT